MDKYLIMFFLGHILGDFYFQTDSMARKKNAAILGVLKHSAEYAIVMYLTLLPVMNSGISSCAFILSITHFLIDIGKYYLLRYKHITLTYKTFVIDQALHISSIIAVGIYAHTSGCIMEYPVYLHDVMDIYSINVRNLALWILVLLILHLPSNILIQNIVTAYKPINNSILIVNDNKIGRMIGSLERLIMIILMASGQYAAVGLVLTAKSIARYEKISKDEKFAEYYLLGTLLSVACVVVCKAVFLY